MKRKSVTMKLTVQLVGLAVALLLMIGCEGAPSQNVEARSILVNPHIIMGKDANIEDVPYQISIEYVRTHACGGAIISEDWVITAAHCIDPVVSGKPYFKRIRAGSTITIPIIGWGGEIHQIADSKYHPLWDINIGDYDVGVIRVFNQFVYSDRIRPIKMAPVGDDFLDFGRKARVSGWGVIHPDDGFKSLHLQVADIPLVPLRKCRELYEGAPAGTPEVTTRMVCGAGTGNGAPCQGDSGGPLVHKNQLIGLVSWAIGCNEPNHPEVFTNVMNDEIRRFVKENTGIET